MTHFLRFYFALGPSSSSPQTPLSIPCQRGFDDCSAWHSQKPTPQNRFRPLNSVKRPSPSPIRARMLEYFRKFVVDLHRSLDQFVKTAARFARAFIGEFVAPAAGKVVCTRGQVENAAAATALNPAFPPRTNEPPADASVVAGGRNQHDAIRAGTLFLFDFVREYLVVKSNRLRTATFPQQGKSDR
jgi:hypothetical protein